VMTMGSLGITGKHTERAFFCPQAILRATSFRKVGPLHMAHRVDVAARRRALWADDRTCPRCPGCLGASYPFQLEH